MNYYGNVRANQRYRYVFSCVDIFTKFAWFVAIKTKDAPSTLEAFKKILQYNLRFKSAGDRSGGFDYPRVVVSDNGAEFKGELETFLREHGVRHITTKSYTPEPHIENLNGRLRHMIRDNFIRTNSLAWYPYLPAFMDSKNTNVNETTRETPMDLMVSYFAKDHPRITQIAGVIKRQKEQRFERFHKQEDFAVGDLVRVKMTAIQSALRKKVKEGNKKLIVIRFSPALYRIARIIPVKRGQVGFPKYVIEDLAGHPVLTSGGNPKRFNSGDILKVSKETQRDHRIDLSRANFLNRIPANDKDLQIPRVVEPPAAPIVRPPLIREPKPVSKYSGKDWTDALKGKSFVDFDGKQAIIKDVYYSYGDRTFVVDYLVNGVLSVATLGDVLDLSQGESWFLPEYKF
jgi:transposase InsO family protein